MKKLIYLAILSFLLSGCAPTEFFQLYNVESKKVNIIDDNYIYENDEIKIIYDIWQNNGNSSFIIYNKTDKDIFIDLSSSHLIINGFAFTYFQNRIISKQSSFSLSSLYSNTNIYTYGNQFGIVDFYLSGYSTGNLLSVYGNSYERSRSSVSTSVYSSGEKSIVKKGYSISYNEKKIICIPTHSAKIIDGFKLKENPFRNCKLFRFPSSKKISKIEFSEENTPLKIENRITYSYSIEFDKFKKVINTFWVSDISNYPFNEFIEWKKPEYCGEKLMERKKYYKLSSPNKFFIKYYKSSSTGQFSH